MQKGLIDLFKHTKHFSLFACRTSGLKDHGRTGLGFRQLQVSLHIFQHASPELSEVNDPLNQQALNTLRSNKLTLILYGKEDNLGHHRAEIPIWRVLPGHDTKILSVKRTLETFLLERWRIPLPEMSASS